MADSVEMRDGRPNIREMIKIFSECSTPIFLPKGSLKQGDVISSGDVTSNSESTDQQIYLEDTDTDEDAISDEDESADTDQFSTYLNIPEIVDETKNFLREEENYCSLLEDLIENYVEVLETDKFEILEILGRIDLICAFQNNTFLPSLKISRNVSMIADCFIKHKKLFNTYYENYFKNRPNMILIMQERKDLFKASHTENEFKKYENILLKYLNDRIESYHDFLESMKNILQHNVDVTNFDRALEIIKNLTKNFSQKNENVRYVISEIVQTEKTYIERLGNITEQLIPKIQLVLKQKSKQKSVIGNVALIYTMQFDLYEDLKECLFAFNPNEVGDCFIQHKNLFLEYIKDQQMKNNPKAIDECGELLKKENQRNFDFHAPLNRLYKYKLLLQELRKSCEKGGIQHEKVDEAFNMITGTISKMNGIAAINCIRDENICLEDQGELVLRNEFVITDNINRYRAMVFLFDKSVIMTEIKFEGPKSRPRDVYMYKNHIIMKHLAMVLIESSPTNFQLQFHGKSRKSDYYLLEAMDKETKSAWVDAIKYILMKQFDEAKYSNV